ncbi:MAG TPA: hypothetical protein VEJ63_17760 [Planctomycetota bacterium]|nr:hypothetical protein [Planctomycetota bacterium]
MNTQQKLWWTACAAGALTVLLQSPAFAQKAFLDRAKKVYSLTRATGNCALCHKFDKDKGEAPHDENLNVYGESIRVSKHMTGLRKKGEDYEFKTEQLDQFETAMKSVESNDADNDGATNLEELALGTYPGDPKSTPEKDALEKYRKEKTAKPTEEKK